MYHLKSMKKVLAFLTCTVISAGILTVIPSSGSLSKPSAATTMTLAEIQEKRKENEAKIAELEANINALEGDKAREQEQQEYLEAQVKIIQDNINLINAELKSLDEDIKATEDNIVTLDYDIQVQQESIDENIELFKKRLCAMYVNSNDTSASLILGSSSFYDVMSRVQVINRIAEYDDKLINDIVAEIESLDQSKKSLQSEQLILEMKLDEQEKRKVEKAAELEVFNEKMKETQYELERIAMEQQKYSAERDDLQKDIDAMNAEEAEILDAIKRQQEEAQRQWELQQQQQQQQQQAQTPSGNGNAGVQGPSYIPPTPSESGFSWPAPGFSYISSYYGPRPSLGGYHYGIDVGDGGIMGGSAVAAQSGTVVAVYNGCTHNYAKYSSCGCGGGYGNYVTISHDGTYSTHYGHLGYASVSVGEYVQQGQAIGAIGSTGWSTGAHLHFEVIVNGARVNPLNYVSQ